MRRTVMSLLQRRKSGLYVGMAVVVQKYGGSSVADADRLRRVAERVMATRKLGHDVVVVVSAMGDTTDDLLTLAKKVSSNPDRRELDMLLSAGEDRKRTRLNSSHRQASY